jgi:hypothetical protein
VEVGENEEGAAVVAFSCMAHLTASLPSSALTERRCHRNLASVRRPYFSASGIHTQQALPIVPPPYLDGILIFLINLE